MSQVYFPIILPYSSDPPRTNDSIENSMSFYSSSSSSSAPSCLFSSNLECTDARDDYDVQFEEDRNKLLARTSSLSFSIDHYCLMIEKVFISFLRSYKRHCTMLDNRSQSVKTCLLGNRLRVFIKEVLPSHIHYHTDFKGYERVMTICSQVDEYLDILKADLDLDDFSENNKINWKNHQYKDDGRSSSVPVLVNDYDGQRGINKRIVDDDPGDSNESHEKGDDRDEENMENASFDKEEEYHCGSSTSTSYSDSGKVDWDDCECTCSETTGKNNGFILKEEGKEPSKDHEEVSEECCDVTDFKTLISHWRAQEKMWIEKRKKMF